MKTSKLVALISIGTCLTCFAMMYLFLQSQVDDTILVKDFGRRWRVSSEGVEIDLSGQDPTKFILPDFDRHNVVYFNIGSTNFKLEDLPKSRSLKYLSADRAPKIGTLKGLSDAASNLEVLSVAFSRVRDSDLIGISKLKNLRKLNFAGVWITSRASKSLKTLNIRDLVLSGTFIGDEFFFELKNELRNLENLDASSTYITSKSIPVFANSKKLKKLNVMHNDLSEASWERLAHIEIDVLDVSYCNLNDNDIAKICQIDSLVSLSLSGNNISETCLIELMSLKNLTYLNTLETSITRKQVESCGLMDQLLELDCD